MLSQYIFRPTSYHSQLPVCVTIHSNFECVDFVMHRVEMLEILYSHRILNYFDYGIAVV